MDQSLQAAACRVMALAKERSLTLATVESCTAGQLAHLLAEAPGAADTLHGGFVVYTKANKTSAVGVPKQLIDRHSAVSGPVAEAMAQGGLQRSPADLVAAITGVAGPEPDEDGNPVGLVYVAAASRDGRSKLTEHRFGSIGKGEICGAAVASALRLLEELATTQTGGGSRPKP